MKYFSASLLPFAVILGLANSAQAAPLIRSAGNGSAKASSGRAVAPSNFEENKGQVRTTAGDVAPFVRYRLTQGNTSIFLLGNGIAYQFNRMHYPEGYAALQQDERLDPTKQQELDALRKEVRLETYRMDMLLEGANANALITTEGRSDDFTQYYNHDALDVHTCSRVTYHEVYPGIDWVVYTTAKGIKYDFVVRPGADPTKIQLRFKDHEELYVDADGGLIHGNRMGRFTEERPVSFQNGKEVKTRFVLDGDLLRFALDEYDLSQSLIIDPDRLWSTYYGGTGNEEGTFCTVDGSDNVYMAGSTDSGNGISAGGHQITQAGDQDAYLVKFSASGVRQWATYYGGPEAENGYSCAVDNDGNVYLAGTTASVTAIAMGGHQNAFAGEGDAFLVKFNSGGVRQWATYYGGVAYDTGRSCAVDNDGNVYLVGLTASDSDIASGGYQNTYGGGVDLLMVKFNNNGVRQWATYYGGTGQESANACAMDGSGNIYLAGMADGESDDFTFNGHQNAFGGYSDAFLVKFTASGERQWATYYGGTAQDYGAACSVDGNENVYLTGSTLSSSDIASGGHENTFHGGTFGDAFLVKFNASGVRQWATYYGGIYTDSGGACPVDTDGNVYLAGSTGSLSGIAFEGYQNIFGGGAYDGYLVKFSPDGVRQWGTYYGGAGDDHFRSCHVNSTGKVYVPGTTFSTTGIASDGFQNDFGGGDYDAFLVKFDGSVSSGISSSDELSPSFSIWPNPNTGDRFYLRAQETALAEVQLFDGVGKLQGTEQLRLTSGQNAEVVFGSTLAKGLYMVRVTVEGRSSVAPLVVE